MRMTCRFRHSRAARVASRTLVAVFFWIGLLPGASRGVVYASDITPPTPPTVHKKIEGFADTHVHQFSNLGFGGLEVWGSPVDPTFDADAFMADPDAARRRALPDSDYLYLSAAQAADYLGLGDLPVTLTPAATKCELGLCFAATPPGPCPPGTGTPGNPCWRIAIHGFNGQSDLLNRMIAHLPEHGTAGFPLMLGWPAFDVVTAQQVYWEWLKRAHDHGLKLMSMLAVNNQVLCHVAPHLVSDGCDDDSAVVRQIEGAYKLQEYIDKLEGGPGKGFYRIVTSAEQARAVIEAGQLAVVLGAEVDTPWGCRVDGSCTSTRVHDKVQEYYDKGIRVVYPVHVIDNAFGGAALYEGLFEIANLLVNGGRFHDMTTDCPVDDPVAVGLQWRSDIRQTIGSVQGGVLDLVKGIAFVSALALVGEPTSLAAVGIAMGTLGIAVATLSATLPVLTMFAPMLGQYLATINPDFAAFSAVALSLGGPLLPILATVGLVLLMAYAPGEEGAAPLPNCNERELKDLGKVLVNELMDHGMTIDVDHSDARTVDGILDMAEQRKYPGIISGHTGLLGAAMTKDEANAILPDGQEWEAGTSSRHEGVKTDKTVERIVKLGGTISLALAQGGRARIRAFGSADQFNCGGSSQTFAQVYLYATKGTPQLSAVSFGSDLNGFSTWPVPRYGNRFCGTKPGQLGDIGPGYNPAAGMLAYPFQDNLTPSSPVDRYQFGARTWDYNFDGLAHIGLYPDFIADLEANGLTKADLAPLFNGVEAYVRMWEKIDDKTPPTVRCGTVGDDWHDADVSVPCIAFDTGFDLANAGDASFSLATNVAAGSETDDAATATHPAICDKGGHCTGVVAAISGINVDKKAPEVFVVTPAAGTPSYTVGQVVTADYSCTDLGSGVATCAGPVPIGGNLDTTVGAHPFTVNATDKVGHAAGVAHPYVVGYAICPLYDPTVTKKAGSTVPIKVRLCNATGGNLSSPSLVLHATGVTRTSNNTPATLEDSGNANPDLDFRYDAGLGGYIFNLSTRGFTAGSYVLTFSAGGDPTEHTAAFAVR